MFVRAEKGNGLSVIHHRNDGGKLIKTGGSRAWRNTNPGNIHAPAKDKNDVANYRILLKQFTKLDLDRKLKSLSVKEFQRVLDAIQRVEGWKSGTEKESDQWRVVFYFVSRNAHEVTVEDYH